MGSRSRGSAGERLAIFWGCQGPDAINSLKEDLLFDVKIKKKTVFNH